MPEGLMKGKTMPENKLNIYQKLIEVRKSVPGLSKDKENKFFKFAYVSSSQTLAAVRSEMDKQQLLLIPAIIKHDTRDHKTAKGGHQFLTELTLEYKWVDAENPSDFILCPWAGIGLDEGEKGIGKACTYSEKYFLLKFFNVPTDKDDPDGGGKLNGTKKPPQGQKQDPPPEAPPKDSPNEQVERIETVAKIIKNATTVTEQLCDSNTIAADKNKKHAEIITQWTTYGDLPPATGNAGLMKFTIKRLRTTDGKSKTAVGNLEAVSEPAAADVGDGQEGLPF